MVIDERQVDHKIKMMADKCRGKRFAGDFLQITSSGLLNQLLTLLIISQRKANLRVNSQLL